MATQTLAEHDSAGHAPASARHAPSTSGSRSARWVLIVVFALSTMLGALAFWRYRVSEAALRADLASFARRGAGLSVEQCVDAVIAWNSNCRAIIGLCDASVSRMTNACLKAADRQVYCRQLAPGETADTRFGKVPCARRQVKGRAKKACAAAYRMIAARCENPAL